jgi:hypothetical protein
MSCKRTEVAVASFDLVFGGEEQPAQIHQRRLLARDGQSTKARKVGACYYMKSVLKRNTKQEKTKQAPLSGSS